MTRPWLGKGADPIAADLKNIARSLQTDTLEPWRETVLVKRELKLDDGWAHSEDDSREGILRELQGMISNDRHEQVIAMFEEQERARAQAQQQAIDEKIARRGGAGFMESSISPMTEEEVQERSSALKQAPPQLMPIAPEDEPQFSPVNTSRKSSRSASRKGSHSKRLNGLGESRFQ